jgi:hypothetical protein
MMIFPHKEGRSLVLAVALFLSVLLLGGCTSVEHSYNTTTGFPGLKSYAWAPSSVSYGSYTGPDPVLEANVKVLADQILRQKGFTKVAERPDLVISMSYEAESSYAIRTLTLNIYGSERKELIWRGTASEIIGSISTDAASGDLRRAVQGILAKFPPK